MKRLIAIIGCVLALAGCGTIPGGPEIAAVAGSAVDALTGPDTDYKNYLAHCRAEIKAQAEAHEADAEALKAGINSDDEKIQFGSLILLAAKSGQGGPRIGCTAQRKKGLAELAFENSNILDLGFQFYRLNREQKQFQKRLDADRELASERLKHEQEMNRQNNDLLTTLTGDKLLLQNSSQDDAFRRAQLPGSD